MKFKLLSVLFRRSPNIPRHQIQRTYSSEQPKPFKSIPGLNSLPIVGPLHHFLPVIDSPKKVHWTPGSPRNVLQGSVELSNLADYRVLPKTGYSPDFFTKEYLVIRQITDPMIIFLGTIGFLPNMSDLVGVLYEKFGPIVKMEGIFARANMLFLFEPELYEPLYRAEEAASLRPGFETLIYYREELRKSTFDGVYGLTTAQGEKWREFRTKVNPALLKPKMIKLYAPALEEIATDFVDRLIRMQQGGDYLTNNWDQEITRWSLESVAYVGLGSRLGCLQDGLQDNHPSKQLMQCAKDIFELSFKLELRPNLWKLYQTRNFKKLMKTLDLQWAISQMYIDNAKKQINERGHDIPEEDKSIIERLLAIDEKVAIMMANEMLMAGIDTVSFATTALLYHLAKNPEAQEKARQEILSDEPNKRYLRACLKESLRIWPVVSAHLRRTSREHIVGGYCVPKGVDVVAPNEFISKLEKNYPRAKEFVPERWLADKADPLYYGNTHPMITMPFGFGIRSCIGRRIAELEIETVVKKILERTTVKWQGPPIKVVTTVMNQFLKPYYFRFETIK